MACGGYWFKITTALEDIKAINLLLCNLRVLTTSKDEPYLAINYWKLFISNFKGR
jgi:hypothetical protein